MSDPARGALPPSANIAPVQTSSARHPAADRRRAYRPVVLAWGGTADDKGAAADRAADQGTDVGDRPARQGLVPRRKTPESASGQR